MNATISPSQNGHASDSLNNEAISHFESHRTPTLTADTNQKAALSPVDCADLNFAAYTLQSLFEKLEEHADPDSGKAKRYGRIAEFLREINDEAARSDWTPEDATGWAVSLTLVIAENRLHSLNPNAFVLVKALAEMFLYAARLLEANNTSEIGTDIKTQIDASLDFISNSAAAVAAA